MADELTDRAVRNLKPRAKEYFVWDGGATGLGIKITPAGRRIWVLQLVYPGGRNPTKRTLGIYPSMGLAAAREKAREWYGLVKAGIDPADIERQRREAADQARASTFGKFAEAFIAKRTNRRADLDAREIRRTLIAAWKDRPLASITPRDIRQLIGEIAKRAPWEARNAWGHASLIFKHAVHEELIEVSPMASLDKELTLGVKLRPRDRVLNDLEVRALWHASHDLPWPHGHLYRWLLLTGVRMSEATGAEWTEFHPEVRRVLRDLAARAAKWSALPAENKTWTIPPERFKSDVAHVVPLTDQMLELLASVPAAPPARYVFSTTGKNKLWSSSKVKRDLDRRMLALLRKWAAERGEDPDSVTLAPWVAHDLRRVVRSNLSALGIADNVAEMVLGHGKKGLQRIYDQYRYIPQIREALTKWNARLMQIV